MNRFIADLRNYSRDWFVIGTYVSLVLATLCGMRGWCVFPVVMFSIAKLGFDHLSERDCTNSLRFLFGGLLVGLFFCFL